MFGVERVEMARICIIFGILTILFVGSTQGKKPYIRLGEEKYHNFYMYFLQNRTIIHLIKTI